MTTWRVKDRWYVKVMREGKMYHARRGFIKKEDALQAQSLLKATLKTTRSPHGIFQENFLNLWVRYLDHSQAYNGRDWYETKKYTGSRYFVKWFTRPIGSITPQEIEAHLIERKTLSARSSNLDYEILHNFFSWCVGMGHLGKTPFGPLRKFPISKVVKTIPTSDDIEKLLTANEGQDRLLILLLVYTMGRISEIMGLTWKRVDLEKRVLYLVTRKTRDGSEKIREIPIGKLLLDCLISVPDKTGFLLKSSVTGENYRDLRKVLKRCFRKTGLPLIGGFHQFRHYGASVLADKGAPLNVVQDLLGHTSLSTTNIYLQSLRESKRKAMEML